MIEVTEGMRERLRMAMAAAKAARAVVTPESDMSRRRLEVCKTCENWTGHTCKVCGCFTALKVRLPDEACPIGKWAAER
jgi:rubrerythrin